MDERAIIPGARGRLFGPGSVARHERAIARFRELGMLREQTPEQRARIQQDNPSPRTMPRRRSI